MIAQSKKLIKTKLIAMKASDPRLDPKVDALLAFEKRWRPEMEALRALALGAGLSETMKWGQACYMDGEANVVLFHGFKDYCAYLFFKGALLADAKGLLVQQTANVQAGRQIRFSDLAQIKALTPAIKHYLQAAIALERSGAKVPLKATRDFALPAELKARLDSEPALKKAFAALSPGRQRGYLRHIGQAKRAETRVERVAKHAPRILKGLGLDD